jgi:hypothetical protein
VILFFTFEIRNFLRSDPLVHMMICRRKQLLIIVLIRILRTLPCCPRRGHNMSTFVMVCNVASSFGRFIHAGSIPTILILILRLCQIGWALLMLFICACVAFIIAASSTGLCDRHSTVLMSVSMSYPVFACVAIYMIAFVIRWAFINIVPERLSQSDVMDHLRACRLFILVMVLCSNRSPKSQALLALCLLNVEYKLSRVTLNRG